MSTRNHLPPLAAAGLFLLVVLHHHIAAVGSIGVNYGTLANNLANPWQVAQFLKERTTIDRIKIFSPNREILNAFANTGILVAVTVPNLEIPGLTNIWNARRWVDTNIRPFHPKTRINYLLVGNEITQTGLKNLIDNLLPAMKTLHQALLDSRIYDIKVTTPHSFSILARTEPPSQARFQPSLEAAVLVPMLQFLREVDSPLMVNPYAFYGYSPERANFCLFRPNRGVYDANTRINYENLFDMMMDAVYSVMKTLGYGDVDIAVGETGWPSLGGPIFSVENAAAYNGGIVRKINSGVGTPLMPHRRFDTYIFALFNENQKTGGVPEQNFGLFRPDFTPVYNAGVSRLRGAIAGDDNDSV